MLWIMILGVFVLLMPNNAFSQKGSEIETSKFLILIESYDNGLKLTSPEGCAWTNLGFSLEINKWQLVNQYGMTNENEDNDDSSFLFGVKRTSNGIELKGIKGTSWNKLSFSCVENKCHQYIDQDGMTIKD